MEMARLRATSSDEASDEALLAGMAVGDERAGVAFVRRYQRRVYGLALGILRDPGMAEDVAQDAFVRAWTHASVFDPRRGAAATWLLTIARNLSILQSGPAPPRGGRAVDQSQLGSDDYAALFAQLEARRQEVTA